MPYTAEISRKSPACILFLLDQSGSMVDMFAGGESGQSKAAELASIINRIIQEIVVKCSRDDEIMRYFQVGVIGYGASVEPAFSGILAGQPLVWIDELAMNPLRLEQVSRRESDGAGGLVERSFERLIWFDPVSQNGTPMKTAFELASAILKTWVAEHPSSFPPVVMNITDGESTDGDLSDVARRMTSLSTGDGDILLLNLHLSSRKAQVTPFPDAADQLPDIYAKMLFDMSSVMPGVLREAAQQFGYNLGPDARGFMFNANAVNAIEFLTIGTRAANR